jgi:TPR repeat protein
MKLRDKKQMRAEEKYLIWVNQSEEGNTVHSFPILLEAAKLGSERARVQAGYDYAYGVSGDADRAQAIYWWKLAYKQGSWDAAFNLGAYFRDAREWNRAVKWFERSVAAGDVDGLVEIAKIHLRYDGDRATGIRYLKLAKAAKKRLTKSERNKLEKLVEEQSRLTPGDLIYMEAERLNERGKYVEAYPLLVKGAALGEESCQVLLGNYLTSKTKGVSPDREKGIFWYETAYKNGSMSAAENLAMTFLKEKISTKLFIGMNVRLLWDRAPLTWHLRRYGCDTLEMYGKP